MTTICKRTEDNMKFYIELLSFLVSRTIKDLQRAQEELTNSLNDYVKACSEENKGEDHTQAQKEALDHYEQFHTQLYEKMYLQNRCLDYIEMMAA